MSTASILWLLPVVFMIHDFEEIIMGLPWLRNNEELLQQKAPRMAGRIISMGRSLSVSSFALAVAGEFVLLSAVTLLAVEMAWYNMWCGLMLGFGLHLVVHVVQTTALRRYVPVIVTTIPALGYCGWALWELVQRELVAMVPVLYWTLGWSLFIVANLAFVHRVARGFEAWLRRRYPRG